MKHFPWDHLVTVVLTAVATWNITASYYKTELRLATDSKQKITSITRDSLTTMQVYLCKYQRAKEQRNTWRNFCASHIHILNAHQIIKDEDNEITDCEPTDDELRTPKPSVLPDSGDVI